MLDNQTQDTNLRIQALELHNFRNYSHLQLNNIGNLSLFVGKNAIGKTSIIEAIQLVTALKSFRATHGSQLNMWGTNQSSVTANFSNGQRYLTERLEIIDGKRAYYLNDKKQNIQDIKGLVPAVVFTPDDLELVKGSHSIRRTSLDDLGSQLSKNFYVVKNDYQKLLRQKSQALKDEADKIFIYSINEVLAKVGAQFFVHRRTLCNKLSPFLESAYHSIVQNDETLQMSYIPHWTEEGHTATKEELEQHLFEQMNASIDEERSRKKNLIGPQTDEIVFYLNDQNSIHYASQGQQRSIVLAYKIAEANTIQEIRGQQPVLLLDDVMSELDESRRIAFMNFVQQDRQTFITTTNLSYFDEGLIKQADVYELPFN